MFPVHDPPYSWHLWSWFQAVQVILNGQTCTAALPAIDNKLKFSETEKNENKQPQYTVPKKAYFRENIGKSQNSNLNVLITSVGVCSAEKLLMPWMWRNCL